MKTEFVSKQDVQQACQQLGLSDWSALTEARVTPEEARLVQEAVGGEAKLISALEFQKGLEVELEHGTQYSDSNVTNNHPLLAGKIVLAHLKEMLDYYSRLEVAELEGDMLKAFQSDNPEKLFTKFGLLLQARSELAQKEISQTR
ncbi:MAG: hypothetical protein MUO54_07245 [Anaerolineales bacterium]|nr:hypothetical protein [Anaerolineales bacterium]